MNKIKLKLFINVLPDNDTIVCHGMDYSVTEKGKRPGQVNKLAIAIGSAKNPKPLVQPLDLNSIFVLSYMPLAPIARVYPTFRVVGHSSHYAHLVSALDQSLC